MTFKIVSVGWRCAGWWEQTLRSIEGQSTDDWDVQIRYDGGDAAGTGIQAWCAERDERWHCTVNDRQLFAVRNQVEAIHQLDPADDDVIVFLDLDGDQFAHPDVLAHLADAYADGTLLTYGSFEPVPITGPWQQAVPFPPAVVRAGSYRQHILHEGCCFNHLRTMKGAVAKAIPDDHFRWASGPKQGEWYSAGTDYIFMTAGLELAGGRYKCLPETLLLYNNANPNADYLSHPKETGACTQNYLRRPPLRPLTDKEPVAMTSQPEPVLEYLDKLDEAEDVGAARPESRRPRGWKEPYLPPPIRRQIIADVGKQWGLTVLIETGTANGDTPAALMHDFEQIHTIEVDPSQYAAAVRRFEGTNVACWHGDSAYVMPELLNQLGDTPALVWADGHFCGSARGDKDTPVLEELEAIFATGVRHVILVDDARLFEGMSHYGEHDWPHIDEVRKLAERHDYDCVIVDDIARLTPRPEGDRHEQHRTAI